MFAVMESVLELETEQKSPYSPCHGPKQSTPYKTISLNARRAVNSPGQQSPLSLKCHAKVRNEYLRTVLSPRGKTFSPSGGTPSGKNYSPVVSPVLKTPIRDANFTSSSQYTPRGTSPPSWTNSTYNRTANPFESAHSHTELQLPTFLSPGIFTVSSTPSPAGAKPFRWSIEHLAVLHPADIEEMPHQESVDVPTDVETETKAQKAIDHFFANHLIAPSPWSSGNKKKKKTVTDAIPMEALEPELQGSIHKQLPGKKITREAASQTVLTLPTDVDVNKILAQYMTYESVEEVNQEVMSTSSLRRKLFFQGDNSSLAISPVRDRDKNTSIAEEPGSPRISPLKKEPMNWDLQTPAKTPNTHFASSPIGYKELHVEMSGSPPFHDSFTQMDALASPELHYENKHDDVDTGRSSGIFCPQEGSFLLSPVLVKTSTLHSQEDDHRSPADRASPGLSPIRPSHQQKRPNRSEKLPRSLVSPNMSPIGPSPVSRRLNNEGSFIQAGEDVLDSEEDHDKSTPIATIPQSPDRIHKMTEDMFSPDDHLGEMDHTAMDFESAPVVKNLRFADDIRTSSLLVTRDFSMIDTTESECAVENLTNQDTGYYTTSMQSTNQDTGLHTNLTCQFGSLPFNTTSQDTGYQTNSIQSLSQEDIQSTSINLGPHCQDIQYKDKLVDNVFALAHLKSDVKSYSSDHISRNVEYGTEKPTHNQPHKNVKSQYVEDDVIRRAKQVLATEDNILKASGDMNLTSITGNSILDIAPQHCSTPQKLMPVREMQNPFPFDTHQRASVIALEVMRRAEDDLVKFGQLAQSGTAL